MNINKDITIYFCMNSHYECMFYYYGGVMSSTYARIHYKLLCNKNKGKSFYLRKIKLSNLLEEYWEEFGDC